MAEVIIGGVASSITIGTLAAQITSSIIKSRGYWDQIQNAPEDVQDLIEELEIFNNLLTDIENDQRQNPMSSLIWDSNSTCRCLQYCKKAAERLKDLTETLRVELEARKKMPRRWAAVKVVLKKDKIDRYKSQLERAVRLLSLSYQLYTRTLLQIQPDILVAKLSRSIVPTPHLSTASDHHFAPQSNLQLTTEPAISIRSDREWSSSLIFGNFFYSRKCYSMTKGKTRDVAGRKKEVEVILAQYRSPSWLANKIWHLKAVKASRGWDYSPRVYNVVDMDRSPVFQHAYDNNVRGLQELFCERRASPFDCDVNGITVLMYAARHSSFEACDLLIKEGADPNYIWSFCGSIALGIAMRYPRGRGFEAFPRLLFNETEFTPSMSNYRGSAKGFVLWQEALDPAYYQKPLEIRFEVAETVAYGCEPELFKTALDRDSILQPLTKENSKTLHVVAQNIGFQWVSLFDDNIYIYWGDRETRQANLKGWLSMLKDLIAMNYYPHPISSRNRTPLLDVVHTFILHLELNQKLQLPVLLGIWLESLQNCGVDLWEYGRKETELYQQGLVLWDCPLSPTEIWRITSFAYGSSPSDWNIKLEPLDDSDTETPSDMPGGWIKDNDFGGEVDGVEVEGE